MGPTICRSFVTPDVVLVCCHSRRSFNVVTTRCWRLYNVVSTSEGLHGLYNVVSTSEGLIGLYNVVSTSEGLHGRTLRVNLRFSIVSFILFYGFIHSVRKFSLRHVLDFNEKVGWRDGTFMILSSPEDGSRRSSI